jgi:hypothetical protein
MKARTVSMNPMRMMTTTAAAVPAVTTAAAAAGTKSRKELMRQETGNEEELCSTLNRRLLTSFEESRAQDKGSQPNDRDKDRVRRRQNRRQTQEGISQQEHIAVSEGDHQDQQAHRV